ncbi:hypothetical protein SR18_gp010 [Caulobacter phage SR18]|nr:hypothetical protein SR18_gp010 [Caulobacter phage SR18]
MKIIPHPRGGIGRSLAAAALYSASAQPQLIESYKRDAASAIEVRDEPVPVTFGGRAGGGKTRQQRKAMAKAAGLALMDLNAAQLDMRYLHPRWLRRVVAELLDMHVPVVEADVTRWRAQGHAATLLEVFGE